ncbi:hypothetical protein ISN45_At02g004710 [Arabidopsis thaliana x Arabidopsis arenosa]|uniref:Transmembrane protein n=1 Tax=Arabidopsis thaliana x Arabidopsis arenosa TaxID=1240361 RepID=A0A8T2FNB2_9BRAS|nr:hypothetical protein ISN45_At02g004710 [Arabidopsis thaliana x Arabidopsis arenosa]
MNERMLVVVIIWPTSYFVFLGDFFGSLWFDLLLLLILREWCYPVWIFRSLSLHFRSDRDLVLWFCFYLGVKCRLVSDVTVSERKCEVPCVVLSLRIMKISIGVLLLLGSLASLEED